jgi:hypothetical protein
MSSIATTRSSYAEVPGVNKEDLEISVTGNLFTIRGQGCNRRSRPTADDAATPAGRGGKDSGFSAMER